MDNYYMHFPLSGVTTLAIVPPAAAFVISFFTSMAGISGAFLLLPFQMSVLGFTSTAVTSTNFLYNVLGTPGGVFRYFREKRLPWPLVGGILGGTVPGLMVGYYIRVSWLPDARTFKLFVGVVLLYVALRLGRDILHRPISEPVAGERFSVCRHSFSLRSASFTFMGKRFCFSVPGLFLVSFGVGILSGIYGIGGGTILAPFCVSFLNLPVYAVAGAILASNFMTSLAGLCVYSLLPLKQGIAAPPDWLLGFFFGAGGLTGMYFGAKCQRYLPEKPIQFILASIVLAVSVGYIRQYFS